MAVRDVFGVVTNMRKIISSLLLLTALFFLCIILYPTFVERVITTPAPPVLPTYAVRDVEKVCQTLEIADDSTFCSQPTGQTARTLNVLFAERFPVGKATYFDIEPAFASFRSLWWGDCPDGVEVQNLDFLLNNCPAPGLCRWYVCMYKFPGTMRSIRVEFDMGGTLLAISAPLPGDS